LFVPERLKILIADWSIHKESQLSTLTASVNWASKRHYVRGNSDKIKPTKMITKLERTPRPLTFLYDYQLENKRLKFRISCDGGVVRIHVHGNFLTISGAFIIDLHRPHFDIQSVLIFYDGVLLCRCVSKFLSLKHNPPTSSAPRVWVVLCVDSLLWSEIGRNSSAWW
jgi:hypothetical protein